MRYTAVTIIYNPTSTGNGAAMSRELAEKLEAVHPRLKVDVVPTEYAGHADVLAYEAAKTTKKPFVVSASGDGGYNEVINGLMRAMDEGAKPVASLLPAGNANDHFRNLHLNEKLTQAILNDNEKQIDLLCLKASVNGSPYRRYAHSYIGVGLTPRAAVELNKINLNFFHEARIVLKVLLTLKPVSIKISNKRARFYSLICSNINQMSKVLTVSSAAKPDDGKFEIKSLPAGGKLKFLLSLLHATTIGWREDKQTNKFKFRTIAATDIQLDGEVLTLDPNSQVEITINKRCLRCIV